MTNEEAIKAMTKYMPKDNDSVSLVLREAMNMGIKALGQEPCEDCISRAEALKNLALTNSKDDVYRMINSLSSVQPQPDVFDKIRAEIDRQEKWLLQAGCIAYNVDIALDAIKTIVAESEDKE